MASHLADPLRFRPIEDVREDHPALGFSGADGFRLDGEELLITDPVYLADVYNAGGGPAAEYVRANGVVVAGFGGDSACAVWWKDPILLLPLSLHAPRRPHVFKGAQVLARQVGCDSGSFVLLPLPRGLPAPVAGAVEKVLDEGGGARVRLPPGSYRAFYEQHDVPERSHPALCRHVVLYRWKADGTM